MFKWIGYLLINIMFLGNIQGIKNDSYIWRISGIKRYMDLDSTGKKVIKCWDYDVFQIIQDKLNFRYEIVHPIPSLFGTKENGTLTGMVGQINSNKADMTVVPLFITYDRFEAMDFAISYAFHPIHFMLKIGGHESNWNSIIRPFSFELWIALIILTIIFGILLRQVMKCESSNESRSFQSFQTVIWYLFGTLALQGGNLRKVYKIPSRFSIAVWLLSVVILVSSYSGNLMSFMTSPVFEYVPTTFDELASSVQNGKFACGTLKGSSITPFIMNSKTGNAKILADHMISNKKNINNMEELIARVLKGKFAFIGGYDLLTSIINDNGYRKLLISEDSIVTFSTSYGLRKGFSYKKELDKTLSRLFQSGINLKLHNHGQSIEIQNTSEFRPLTIEDLLSPFALLIVGYILSFTCLITELVITKMI